MSTPSQRAAARICRASEDGPLMASEIAEIIDEETASADLLEALRMASKLIQDNRHRFPKSIQNTATFQLCTTDAAINAAIRKATGDQTHNPA